MANLCLWATVLATFVLSTVSATGDNSVVNAKVERNIDISSQLVKIQTQVVVLNKGQGSLKEYLIQFGDRRHDDALSYMVVSHVDPGSKIKTVLKTTKEQHSKQVPYASYRVELGQFAPSPGASVQLEIEATFTHLLDPYPEEIVQADRQLVVYKDRIYFPTPYHTETQTTKVRLPSSTGVESYTKLRPVTYSDRFINYGPYDKIPPTDPAKAVEEELRIHVESNVPFLTVQNLHRTIQVSHWAGAVSVEEILDVVHTGSKLKGPFSRYEYQRDPSANGVSSVRLWRTRLPAGAYDIYYRDEIGNISTSNVRSGQSGVYVDIKPRFPLFGGWKTQYILGYTLPAKNVLFAMDSNTLTQGEYVLKMPFVDHIYDNMVIDNARVRIILPEGASRFRLTLPYEIRREADEVFYSYLDTVGRPVIVLTKKNLVEWHIQPFEVHYQFQPFYLLQEPLLIVSSIFGLCILVMALVRTKISLDGN